MRNLYWDHWKGVAIIAVVVIHALGTALTSAPTSLDYQAAVAIRQLINFPVALFVFIAAFFSFRPSRVLEPTAKRVVQRITRLLWPYLAWAAIYLSLGLASGNKTIADVPLLLLNGRAISVGYYVIVMIQLALLSPALERLSVRMLSWLLPCALVLSASFTYSVRLTSYEGIWANFPYNALPFFLWLPFYVAGLLVARKGLARLTHAPATLLRWSVSALILAALVEGYLLQSFAVDLAISQLKVSSMLASLGICTLVAVSAKSWQAVKGWKAFTVWLGSRSYYFYLSHILVLNAVQRALSQFSALDNAPMAFVLASVVVTISACCLSALLADRLLMAAPRMRRLVGLS